MLLFNAESRSGYKVAFCCEVNRTTNKLSGNRITSTLDAEFQPEVHANYEVPHYDFHHYFISEEEQQAIKGQDLHHH